VQGREEDGIRHQCQCWVWAYNAFAEDQNRSQIGTHIMQVVVKAMNPARYTTDPVLLRTRLDRLN